MFDVYRIKCLSLLLLSGLTLSAHADINSDIAQMSAEESQIASNESNIATNTANAYAADQAIGSQDSQISSNTAETSQNTQKLVQYMLNLGQFLGYDLTSTPPSPASPLLTTTSNQLLVGASGQLPLFTNIVDTFLGSIPINALFPQFFPSSNAAYSPLNALANATFPSYDSPSTGGASATSSQGQSVVTVNNQLDQKTYQKDPVSQAILNILGTPDDSFCTSPANPAQWTGGTTTGGQQSPPNCIYLYSSKIINSVAGTPPLPTEIFSSSNGSSGSYNQQFLNQLNSNSLVAPLFYSTESNTSNSTSSSPPSNGNSASGLTAQNQAQEAANFIRYATGSVLPTSQPQQRDYYKFYNLATNYGGKGNTPLDQQLLAKYVLSSYFTRLRVYAAQISVGYSNLYYILSKRLPQSTGSNSPPASQALNEFTMATWRLYNPDGGKNPQWISQINQASSATVQKEMVTLLAEINYQLYLTRQQEERLLLTNTMLLMLSSRSSQPVAPSLNNVNNNLTESQSGARLQ